MKILVACEESQAVTIEFRKLGHEAYSCDVQECSGGHPEWHIVQDVLPLLNGNCEFKTCDNAIHKINGKWDMIIAHPPCTYLSNAGIAWFNEQKYGNKAKQRKAEREKALVFFKSIAFADCKKIIIENPVGYANSHFKKPTQTIQPCMFGDPENKRTCLWLKGVPKLKPTQIVTPTIYAYYKKGKKKGKPIYWCNYKMFGEDRAKVRSKTFSGIAKAMGNQWGINGENQKKKLEIILLKTNS